MGRNTKGREARQKGNHTPEDIKKGIDLHLGGLSLRKAAKEAKLPYPTLRRYVLKYISDPTSRLEPNYDNKKVFTTDQEHSFKEYIVDCANKFYGLTSKDCRRIAYQMAKINNIDCPLTWNREKMAGKDWMRGFRARHPDLSVKKPEACSLARATAFNKDNIKKFFDNLKNVYNRHPSFACGNRIYNLDETSTTTVHRPQKVLTTKGSNVCKVTSGERGVLVTTCCIVNAAGQALPPAMVFPRKNYKDHMIYGAPPGTLGLASPSGWMNADLFVEVMKHFIKYSCASKENPALLILDNHESHLSIQAIDLAKASGVTMLTLHPHTTAKMQPLDVGLNGPFKSYYNAAVDAWLVRHPGKQLTIYNIAECVGTAYMRAMTPENITHAFKKCGIFPFDDLIFTEVDFLPSEVTNRPTPDVEDADEETDAEANIEEETRGSPSIFNTDGNDELSQIELTSSVLSEKPENLMHTDVQPSQFQKITPQQSTSDINEVPSTSSDFVSPKIFRPTLRAGPRKKINRKPGRSIVATDTPEKNAIAQKKQNKNRQKSLKRPKTVKTDLFKDGKRKRTNSDSSEDNEEEFKCSGSSSGGEDFLSDAEEEEIILSDEFPSITRNPRPKDFVIVAFASKKNKVYYVAEVLEELEKEEYFVSYMKLKSRAKNSFIRPLEPDTAGVNIMDIKYILPRPKMSGSTTRRQAIYKFSVNMTLLNLRY